MGDVLKLAVPGVVVVRSDKLVGGVLCGNGDGVSDNQGDPMSRVGTDVLDSELLPGYFQLATEWLSNKLAVLFVVCGSTYTAEHCMTARKRKGGTKNSDNCRLFRSNALQELFDVQFCTYIHQQIQ